MTGVLTVWIIFRAEMPCCMSCEAIERLSILSSSLRVLIESIHFIIQFYIPINYLEFLQKLLPTLYHILPTLSSSEVVLYMSTPSLCCFIAYTQEELSILSNLSVRCCRGL